MTQKNKNWLVLLGVLLIIILPGILGAVAMCREYFCYPLNSGDFVNFIFFVFLGGRP
jgi:hypothetical protein